MNNLNDDKNTKLIEEGFIEKQTQEESNEEVSKEHKEEVKSVASTNKKSSLRRMHIIYILLGIFICLLITAIYFYRFPPQEIPDPEETSSSLAPTPTPLPEELTSLDSVTILVNKTHPLPTGYEPSNLTSPYVNSTSDVIKVNKLAEKDLRDLLAAAKKAKVSIILNAGYINYETQEDYYADRVTMVGEQEANRTMPMAGYSEHQTGLAFDFTDAEGSLNSLSFAETEGGQWLAENAYKYGFILRYPEDKEEITGYVYMPWHYRYVGKDIAKEMYEIDPNLTMEEYFEVFE